MVLVPLWIVPIRGELFEMIDIHIDFVVILILSCFLTKWLRLRDCLALVEEQEVNDFI